MNSLDASIDQLRRAIEIKEQIEVLEQQLTSLPSGEIVNRNSRIVNGVSRRRTMSASARARIAAAQRARWAKVKKNGASGANPRKRRKMSAAGRAAIAAAARARWAKYRAGK
jgi:hypothetical protein